MDADSRSGLPTVSLRGLFPHAQFLPDEDLRVSRVTERSAECGPGTLFAAISGTRVDAAQFIPEAVAHGACGLLVEHPHADATVPQCIVPSVREAYARLCAAIAGDPSRKVSVTGVTGTNGKTTVTWMIRSLLQQAGQRAGVMGTVEYADGVRSAPSKLTTPDALTQNEWLARMAAQGTRHAAIEMSSHALHQGRIAGTELQSAVVTNITQDHFDYHQTFNAYRDSKARILEYVGAGGVVVLNQDDAGCWSLRDRLDSKQRLIACGFSSSADVSAEIVHESRTETRIRLRIHGQQRDCRLQVVGRHNVANALAAAAAVSVKGQGIDAIAAGLETFAGVPGRLERVACGQPFQVYVDYAHTDDALRRCLLSLRGLTVGRLICVFGAGGDRDRTKRPLLGQAARLADLPIITSDNPRSEDPQQIIQDILRGIRGSGELRMEVDRRRAIEQALAAAQPHDCVLIAGKGHEREQIIGDKTFPFDDVSVAREVLAALGWHPDRLFRKSA